MKRDTSAFSWGKSVFFTVFFVVHTLSYASEEDAHHQSEKHRSQVEHMLELMMVPAEVDKAANEVLALYSASITSDDVKENVRLIIEAYQKDLEIIVFSVLGWDAQKTIYVNNYASVMNAKDVAATIHFLESESGKNFTANNSLASTNTQDVVKHLMETNMSQPLTELTKALRGALEQLKASEQGEISASSTE